MYFLEKGIINIDRKSYGITISGTWCLFITFNWGKRYWTWGNKGAKLYYHSPKM